MEEKYLYARRLSGLVFIIGVGCLVVGAVLLTMSLVGWRSFNIPPVSDSFDAVIRDAILAFQYTEAFYMMAVGLQWCVLSVIIDLLRTIAIVKSK